MQGKYLFPGRLYGKKLINTFIPRWIHGLSPFRSQQRKHWEDQCAGDLHGYEKYIAFHNRIPILINELNLRIKKTDSILDLGCNCGYYLSEIRNAGYMDLTGVDISSEAIKFGRKKYHFSDNSLISGSFEEVLPQLSHEGRLFSVTYSMGATLELVHPSFDIIKQICSITERYVILIISEWGHSYPRFWEYEFNCQGFLMVKCCRPYDGMKEKDDPLSMNSLLVFQRIDK